MPLPGTRVIPTGWSAKHQPAATSTMTARCDITRPSTTVGTMNPATGVVTPAASAAIATDVPCRIQAAASSDRTVSSGDQQVTFRRYLVAVTVDIAPQVDDHVTVTDAVDPALVGRVLRVVDVFYGSEVWQRTLTCIDNLG